MAQRYFASSVVYGGRIYRKGVQSVPDTLPTHDHRQRQLGTPFAPEHAERSTADLVREIYDRGLVVEGTGPEGSITREDAIRTLGNAVTTQGDVGGPAPEPNPNPEGGENDAPAPETGATPGETTPVTGDVQPPPTDTPPGEGIPSASWTRDQLLAEAARRGITVQGSGRNGYVKEQDILAALGVG